MYRVPKPIVTEIAEYFDQKEFAAFTHTCKCYRSMMKDAKLSHYIGMPNLGLPIIRKLTANQIFPLDTLYQIRGLESLDIKSESHLKIDFGSLSLRELYIECPMLDIKSLPESLKVFSTNAIITPPVTWPQLHTLDVKEGRYAKPQLTHLTDLKIFNYKCQIDKISEVLPTSVRVINSKINDIDIVMPNVELLVSTSLPHNITNCPNLMAYKSDIMPDDILKLAKLPNLSSIAVRSLDTALLNELPKLLHLRVVVSYSSTDVTLEEFKKYLPNCRLHRSQRPIFFV